MDDLEKAIDLVARCRYAIDNAIRLGTEEDTPEGSRFIALSDTLAKQIAANLGEAIQRILDSEICDED
jgi:hypothetical protein